MTFDPPTPETDGSTATRSVMSDGWRTVVLVTWLLVFACMTSVAVSSRTTGRSIWWLGPSIDPAPVVLVAIPVVIVLLPMVTVVRRPARAPRVGISCAILLGLTSLPDLTDRPGVAIAVVTISAAALLSSVAVALASRH